ncbi:hypothetical protein BCR44DRAFT_1437505 [Catenaria anguillulae PL171]|uniref:Uncharacterized protein n=1 Tax=Catenaria anguillulae PL171 TaxID=765915 RepID=A0A1Y2HGM1_9FUNG|nr:hypothetical protein BCR44DRAFT_1437505 [Catenaria anguillulae PL171]
MCMRSRNQSNTCAWADATMCGKQPTCTAPLQRLCSWACSKKDKMCMCPCWAASVRKPCKTGSPHSSKVGNSSAHHSITSSRPAEAALSMTPLRLYFGKPTCLFHHSNT